MRALFSAPEYEPERNKALLIVLVVALCLASFMAGITTMWVYNNRTAIAQAVQSSTATSNPTATANLTREEGIQLLNDILQILDDEYIDPQALDQARLLYGAAAGLVAAVGDPHTMFQEPVIAGYQQERMDGTFEGIGATVEMRESGLTIAQPMPGSPALKAGLLAGDTILEVDGKSVAGLSLTDAVTLIRGPRGSTVNLTIQRTGTAEPFVVSVVRDRIELETVVARMLDGNIGYVQLAVFNAVATKQLVSALDGLRAQKPVGLIFDLRGNPGGYLTTAIEVASQFLARDTLVLTEIRRGQPEEFRASGGGKALDIPLVILVDESSASASEIVAGAVQDQGRGVIIGTQTYGKGSVQATHELINGSSLRVTIAKWMRPDGTNIDGKGVTPDIIVERTQDDYNAGRDPQLERAIEQLLGQ